MEVVPLDVLNRGIAVVADGGDGNDMFQGKGDPGIEERVPVMVLPLSKSIFRRLLLSSLTSWQDLPLPACT